MFDEKFGPLHMAVGAEFDAVLIVCQRAVHCLPVWAHNTEVSLDIGSSLRVVGRQKHDVLFQSFWPYLPRM